jgi:hypothetical protein
VPDLPIKLTVLDVGWDLGHVLGVPAWIGEQIRTAGVAVVVTRATIPGLLYLETTLTLLHQIPAIGAVIGSGHRYGSGAVRQSSGLLTRNLDRSGRLIDIPHDARLAVTGLDSRPLPRQLWNAARTVVELTASAMKRAL